jgi:hypothetical protein
MGTIKANTIQPLTGSDPLVLKTNESERLRILTSGNIGIGTSTPSTLLDVNGTVKSTGMYCTGNVGIGTASPSVPLQVVGTVKNTNPVFEVTYTVTPTAAAVSPTANNRELVWDTKVIDTASAFNTTNGRFTAPVAGKYFFSSNIFFKIDGESTSRQYGLFFFSKNNTVTSGTTATQPRNSPFFYGPSPGTTNILNYASISGTLIIDLAVNDRISVLYRGQPYISDYANFNGYFIG